MRDRIILDLRTATIVRSEQLYRGLNEGLLTTEMIWMNTWFQAIAWVISMISKVYDIVDVRSLKNCKNDWRRFVQKSQNELPQKRPHF